MRISRKRILESAIKVMESYAGNRTMIELEYFDEAGTGLGPTLEFYTLLSHELQKKGLGMWRFDDPASEKAAGILLMSLVAVSALKPVCFMPVPSLLGSGLLIDPEAAVQVYRSTDLL